MIISTGVPWGLVVDLGTFLLLLSFALGLEYYSLEFSACFLTGLGEYPCREPLLPVVFDLTSFLFLE